MSSSKLLQVKVTSRSRDGVEDWQGTVTLAGVAPTKLVRKADNSTSFGSRNALLTSARNFARKYGFSGIEVAERNPARSTQRATSPTA